MALKKKPNRLNINFNFSDDSDDDKDNSTTNIHQTKHILKDEMNCSGNVAEYLHLTADKTIVAGDYLNRHELPSLSEDLGLPITESTLLYNNIADSTMYVTALEDNLNQSKPHHNIATENKHCLAPKNMNTSKLYTSKNRIFPKGESNSETDKENACLITKVAKMRSPPSNLSHESPTNHKNDLYMNGIQKTPVKGNKLFTKHKLFSCDKPSRSQCVEYNEARLNSVPTLPVKLPVYDSQLESSFVDSVEEKTSHKHHELMSESFVEVQDVSIQTSFISEGLSESKQEEVCEFQDIDFNYVMNSSCISTDDNSTDTQAVELSSYEVQDVSVQTSLVEEFLLMDNANNSLHEDVKGQNAKILEISLVTSPLKNVNKESDSLKITLDNKNYESVFSNNTSIHNVAECALKEQYESAFDDICEKINLCAIAPSLRYKEINEGQGHFETELNGKLRTVDKKIHEHQINTSVKPQCKSKFLEPSFQTCPDRDVNFASKERNGSSHINSWKGLSSNNNDDVDADNRCDILAAASDCEDEGNHNNCNNEHAVDKIDESYLGELDTDNDGDDVHCARERTLESYPEAQITKAATVYSEHDTKIKGYSCEKQFIDSGCHTDHKAQIKEATTSAVKICGNKGDLEAKNFTTGHNSVNFNSIQQRKDLVSSDDDSDFENFLSKLKGSLKPQTPSREEMPMDEFIVNDEDQSGSEDEDSDNDDELFYIKTTRDLNELSSRKRHPVRYPETDYLRCHSDDSDSDTSDWQATKIDSCDDVVELIPGRSFPKTPGINTHFPPKKTQLATCEDTKDAPSRGQETLLIKTPRKVDQWKRPFETPALRHVNKEDFKTPNNIRGSMQQPTTAPRFSYGGSLNDDSFFLKSLTDDIPDYKRHANAARFIKFFKKNKAELVQKLFKIFNSAIFEDKLPEDLEIEWSLRYRKTAGTFYYKGTPNNFVSKITLSVKICDSPERVRDTLAHELCHAAVKLINGVRESHGPFWKSWARKINRAFPFLPVIARCHDYIITTKYTYQCVKCNYRIGRHSKSLDTDKKICGHCRGNFEVYLTRELNSSNESCRTTATPQAPRTPNKFALFVKECYSEVKKRENGLRHGDIMKILSQEFAEKNKICE